MRGIPTQTARRVSGRLGQLRPSLGSKTALLPKLPELGRTSAQAADTLSDMEPASEVEFVFEPQDEGGYHVYAPELPGLHTQGDSLEDATENAREALALYVEGVREDGRSLDMGIVRRRLVLPA